MARYKKTQSGVRKLGRIGSPKHGSYYVTLPVELIRSFGWREGQRLRVHQDKSSSRIVIEPYPPK